MTIPGNTQAANFASALTAMKASVAPGVSASDHLLWRDVFEDRYAAFRCEVLRANPQFAPMASADFDRKLRSLKAMGHNPRGLSVKQVETLLGVSFALFQQYLAHFAVNGTEAMVYLGNGQVDLFPLQHRSLT